MRASILDAIIAGPFYNLILPTGVFFTGLALAVGADNFQIGLLAALFPLLSGLSLVAARQLEHEGRRKRQYLITAGLQRGIFLGLLAFPFLQPHLAPGRLVWVLMGLVIASTIFHFYQLTAWMSWMADMIPADRRGSFFSRRNLIAGAVWMVLAWQAGIYLDSHKDLWGYATVFSIGALMSVAGLYFSAQQPDPPMQVTPDRPGFMQLWRSAYTDRPFRNFLYFHLAWGFTFNLGAPFYNVYMLKNLGLDMAKVSLWTVFAGILAVATTPYWGHLVDKAGTRATLRFALTGTCLVGFLWPLGSASREWLLIAILLFSAFFMAGVQAASFNMLLGIVPAQNKPSYLALFQAVVGTLVGCSPVIGGWLAKHLPDIGKGSWALDSVMAVIILSALLRLIPLAFANRLSQSGDRDISSMLGEFVFTNPFKFFSNIWRD